MNSALAHLVSPDLSGLRGKFRVGQRAPIRDDAGLFHADAIARAEQRIDEIRRTFDHNLFVRTVASASPRHRRLFRFLWTPEVNRLLEEQAQKYADESALPAFTSSFARSPRDVHVVVRPKNDAGIHRITTPRRCGARWPDACTTTVLTPPCSDWWSRSRPSCKAIRHAAQSHSVVNEFVLVGLLGGGLALWLVLGTIRFKMRAAARLPTVGPASRAGPLMPLGSRHLLRTTRTRRCQRGRPCSAPCSAFPPECGFTTNCIRVRRERLCRCASRNRSRS